MSPGVAISIEWHVTATTLPTNLYTYINTPAVVIGAVNIKNFAESTLCIICVIQKPVLFFRNSKKRFIIQFNVS